MRNKVNSCRDSLLEISVINSLVLVIRSVTTVEPEKISIAKVMKINSTFVVSENNAMKLPYKNSNDKNITSTI